MEEARKIPSQLHLMLFGVDFQRMCSTESCNYLQTKNGSMSMRDYFLKIKLLLIFLVYRAIFSSDYDLILATLRG